MWSLLAIGGYCILCLRIRFFGYPGILYVCCGLVAYLRIVCGRCRPVELRGRCEPVMMGGQVPECCRNGQVPVVNVIEPSACVGKAGRLRVLRGLSVMRNRLMLVCADELAGVCLG
jgi:hypothetical protein